MTPFTSSHGAFFQNLNFSFCTTNEINNLVPNLWCIGRSDVNIIIIQSSMQYINVTISLQGKP